MGKFRDPLVGRDLLFGVLLGVSWTLIFEVREVAMMRLGASPQIYSTDYLMGVRASIGEWLLHIPQSIQTTLVFFFVLLFFRVLLRKEWLAAIAFVALLTLPRMAGSEFLRVEAPAQILIYGMAVIVVLRFGLVALAAGAFAVDALLNVPLTADFSNWYAANATLALLSIVALAVWSFYCALGGRSPWGQSAEASGLGE
jgi:hypothetical protein